MIKKIAQIIYEANLVLEAKGSDIKALAIDAVGGDRVWSVLSDEERANVSDALGADIFHGENQHKYSSSKWLQPMVESEQIDSIIAAIRVAPKGMLVLSILANLRSEKWGDAPRHVIIRENLKSLLRLMRPHESSGATGVKSDDETTDEDIAWIRAIDNRSGYGLKNIIFQILLPILKDTDFDVTPELEHEDISNSPWEWLRSPIWSWNR